VYLSVVWFPFPPYASHTFIDCAITKHPPIFFTCPRSSMLFPISMENFDRHKNTLLPPFLFFGHIGMDTSLERSAFYTLRTFHALLCNLPKCYTRHVFENLLFFFTFDGTLTTMETSNIPHYPSKAFPSPGLIGGETFGTRPCFSKAPSGRCVDT